ncbi:HycH family protein [Aggregatibacter actinomycetemcomitans]|uniref:formate hydrogenlyase maturation HycH family protein n=1 Tax=Aggregatibacter actinomycetemcomitans TaxID=714 RepID=UPI0011DDA2A0|nr:formate hydrogenlyase maturation HycH family protein [Aggregatibacter actinomycetemcomitans]QEH45407.1 HycH family protein [Aggregatibacter actinomycetemcomitans]
MTTVIFYLLNERFVENDEQVPEQAQQVMYYSLAIGHHVGVIDCFKKLLICGYEDYQQFVAAFPEGEAKRKFAGLMKFGEIVIDSSYVNLLAKALDENKAHFTPQHQQWTEILMDTLASIQREPVMYIMVKRRDE